MWTPVEAFTFTRHRAEKDKRTRHTQLEILILRSLILAMMVDHNVVTSQKCHILGLERAQSVGDPRIIIVGNMAAGRQIMLEQEVRIYLLLQVADRENQEQMTQGQ